MLKNSRARRGSLFRPIRRLHRARGRATGGIEEERSPDADAEVRRAAYRPSGTLALSHEASVGVGTGWMHSRRGSAKKHGWSLSRLGAENVPYIFNKETLGFRLDSNEEISVFRD